MIPVGLVACGDDGTPKAQPDAPKAIADAAPDAPPSGPTFLAPATYADLLTIDAQFPFGVVARHTADAHIAGSHWDRAGGPAVSLGIYGEVSPPKVVAWALPADPTGAATSSDHAWATAANLPAAVFYGADGMIDLPFGSVSLLDYTAGSDAPYPGEALFYDAAYDAVTSRAYANGMYSGVGVTDGTHDVLVYSGLSAIAPAASATNDNGLYAAPICNGKLLDAACAAPAKLAGWTGASGEVVADAKGNVFVAASVSGGAHSDSIYAVTRTQALAAAAVTPADLADPDTGGTSSLAAVAPTQAALGWVVGIGYDVTAGVYASSYMQVGEALSAGPDKVAKAIAATAAVTGLSVFTDPSGNLWLAVTTDTAGYYLELQRTE